MILGVGSASAMVTLRERTTQYGVIVNLPHDHTAASVNAAVTGAFTAMPAHLKRTLTWDQGVEMAKHQDLTAATGVPVFFAERSSPWQRGANETTTASYGSTFPKAATSPATPRHTSTTSCANSTNAPAKASATTPRQPVSPKKQPPHQPAEIASQARSKCPHNTHVLHRLRESAPPSSGVSTDGSCGIPVSTDGSCGIHVSTAAEN
jgi:transposase, IS30 family